VASLWTHSSLEHRATLDLLWSRERKVNSGDTKYKYKAEVWLGSGWKTNICNKDIHVGKTMLLLFAIIDVNRCYHILQSRIILSIQLFIYSPNDVETFRMNL